MHGIIFDMVASVGKNTKYFGQTNIFVSFFTDLVMGKEFPLVEHYRLNPGLTYLETFLLIF